MKNNIEKTSPQKSSPSLLTFVVGLWVGVCLGVVGLFVLGITGVIPLSIVSLGKEIQIDPNSPIGIDQPAKDFSLENISSQRIRLSDLKGKVVVVNFWTTTCGPCVREMPMFQNFQDRYPTDLIVIGIDLQESAEDVNAFLKQFNISYEILLDISGDVGKMYQVYALPNTFFVDQQGIVRFHQVGTMSEDQFVDYLSQLGVAK
jgi:thiol-disulfide isomerase/thioredoxin